jgi:hypothetical protein
MKITFEKSKNLVLIYLYLREFNGKIVKAIPDVLCELLFNKEDDWIGINIFNQIENYGEFKLPQLKDYTIVKDLRFEQTDKQIAILFDLDADINNKENNICNIDYNEDGFFGIEIILDNFNGKTKTIKPFTIFRGSR